jgi:dTDP-glucose pyrophosphorylase
MVFDTASIEDAMRSLEASMAQIVLVVDPAEHLIGVLTDGDLRRALLAGASLDSAAAPLANADCFTVDLGAARADVLELMQARQVAQVPVLDPAGRVVGLHLLHELLAVVERPNWAVVMAGGRGSRLGDLTQSTPKPMLPVAGKPILERIVLHLVGSGIRRIFLSVNYLAEVIESYFQDGRRFGASIEYLRETEPLGTGGSLALLPRGRNAPRDAIVVMNGDLVTQANVGRLLDFHERGGQSVTMAVQRYFNQIPFGCVDADGDRLVSFVEKPVTSQLVNAGIYVVDPAIVESIGSPRAMSMPDVVRGAQAVGSDVRVFELDEDWIDVGRREQLDRARRGE